MTHQMHITQWVNTGAAQTHSVMHNTRHLTSGFRDARATVNHCLQVHMNPCARARIASRHITSATHATPAFCPLNPNLRAQASRRDARQPTMHSPGILYVLLVGPLVPSFVCCGSCCSTKSRRRRLPGGRASPWPGTSAVCPVRTHRQPLCCSDALRPRQQHGIRRQ